jgi:hypothetical protein
VTWPPRWEKPHFKTPLSRKVVRVLKRRAAATLEETEKAKVRRRDRYCRFPLCGCGKMKLALAVCHSEHKGIGGNPAGDRSQAALMIYLCSARHRENAISWDRGTIRIRPLTDQLFAGPCAWDVDLPRSIEAMKKNERRWVEVARERSLHVFEPFTLHQETVLKRLAEMTV